MTASVPATRSKAFVGNRTAPTKSAAAAMSRRARWEVASIVKCELIVATYPPGAVNARLLRMKWLWMECRAGLWAGSCTA